MSWIPAQDPLCQVKGCPDAIETIIIPRTGDLGNFEVRRALPSESRRMVGPFIFFDQMGPGEFVSGTGLDVRPHPHIGLATITYLFDGSIDHADSLGFHKTIYPGDINLMKAGSGIVHSERTGKEVRKNPSKLFGIQSWIALPKEKEEMDCSFNQYKGNEIPIINDNGLNLRIISGEYKGVRSPVKMPSPTLYYDVCLKQGHRFSISPKFEERAIYALSGTITVAGIDYPPMQLLVLRPGDTIDVAAKQDARLVVVGGDPLEGPRHIWWNFVSSRKDRIEQAKADWNEKRFASIEGDADFIPLPGK